jgi:UDP-N-acetylmuramate-alanine ligase
MSRMDLQTHPPRTGTPARCEAVETAGMTQLAGARFHLIGAGGVGMSGLARLLLGKQVLVTGSDQRASAATARLNEMGAKIHVGHAADNLPEALDAVVASAAVREDNPELQLARQRGCPVYKYAQLLGALMDHFDGVAVSVFAPSPKTGVPLGLQRDVRRL